MYENEAPLVFLDSKASGRALSRLGAEEVRRTVLRNARDHLQAKEQELLNRIALLERRDTVTRTLKSRGSSPFGGSGSRLSLPTLSRSASRASFASSVVADLKPTLELARMSIVQERVVRSASVRALMSSVRDDRVREAAHQKLQERYEAQRHLETVASEVEQLHSRVVDSRTSMLQTLQSTRDGLLRSRSVAAAARREERASNEAAIASQEDYELEFNLGKKGSVMAYKADLERSKQAHRDKIAASGRLARRATIGTEADAVTQLQQRVRMLAERAQSIQSTRPDLLWSTVQQRPFSPVEMRYDPLSR